MKTFVFASHNAGKLAEVRAVSRAFGYDVAETTELELRHGPAPRVDETERTYLGNAKLKAEAFFAWCGLPALADDAGLEVSAISGSPGVYSARYSGQGANSQRNIDKLLQVLDKKTDRAARFVSVLVFRTPGGTSSARAEFQGTIAEKQRGSGGFGYDSIFIPTGESMTLAELKSVREVKTHRVLALEKLFSELSAPKKM